MGSPIASQGRASRIASTRPAEVLACRRASRVITVARADLDDLVRRHFVTRSNITHVPNAMDLERFVPGDRAEARRRMGVSSDSFVIATVARLVPQKAVADAIEAVSRIRDITFVIIGDGPERAELRTRATGRGVAAHFVGARDDVPYLLDGADAFVLSSKWEGEPIALLEALAMGLPCVATATDGARNSADFGGQHRGLSAIGVPDQAIACCATEPRYRPDVRNAPDIVRSHPWLSRECQPFSTSIGPWSADASLISSRRRSSFERRHARLSRAERLRGGGLAGPGGGGARYAACHGTGAARQRCGPRRLLGWRSLA